MRLPHSYEGFTIVARKDKFGTWWLDIKNKNGKRVRSYKPPMQAIYIARPFTVAYDNDIKHCHGLIDRINKKPRQYGDRRAI